MCGRLTLKLRTEKLKSHFGLIKLPSTPITPRFNIAPGQPVLAVLANHSVDFLEWGFMPGWAKRQSSLKKQINARIETVAEKPMFRSAFKSSRCLIPASGYYEWKMTADKGKQAYYISPADEEPLALAGIYSDSHSADGSWSRSFALLTEPANKQLQSIHHRMPISLHPELFADWLNNMPVEKVYLVKCLESSSTFPWKTEPVSSLVNDPKNDLPACCESMPTGSHSQDNGQSQKHLDESELF